MIELGFFHELEVVGERAFGMLLDLPGTSSADSETREPVVLPRGRVPEQCSIGDRLRVFCYADNEGRAVATLRMPAGEAGDFVCLRVVDRNEHGVFMVWGLEKDLFVPKAEQTSPMRIDERYVVALTLDKQGRMMGSAKLKDFFDDDLSELRVGQKVRVMAFAPHDRGVKVVVDKRWEGMVFWDDVYRDVKMGTRMDGFVADIREDGRVDVRLRQQGGRGRLEGRDALLSAVEQAGGYLPLHDKSDPEDIKDAIGMSKKAFKRAAGNLLKAGLIRLDSKGIHLVLEDGPPAEHG